MERVQLSLGLLLLFAGLFIHSSSCQQNVVHFGMVIENNTALGGIDQSLIDGFNLWKYWVYTREGGLHFGGENYTIELILQVAADGIPNDTPDSVREPLTRNATRVLLNNNQIDVLLGPFGTARTYWVEDEKIQTVGDSIPFLSIAAGGEIIFTTGSNNTWAQNSGIYPTSWIITDLAVEAEDMYGDLEKTTVALISKADGVKGFYEPTYNVTLPYLRNRTDLTVVFNATYPSTLQTADVAGARVLMEPLAATNARAVLSTGGITADTQVLLALFRAYQYKPALFAMMNAADNSGTPEISPEYTCFSTYYHKDLGYGVPDRYMGLSSGYPALYEEYFNRTFTDPRPPQVSGFMVGWQIGAERAGADWRNSTAFIHSMLSLNVNNTDSFIGPFQFTPDGKNVGQKTLYVQLIADDNGVLQPILLKSAADLVYPAPWPWSSGDSEGDGLDTDETIGVIVGVIVGFVCLVVIVVALIVLVAYLVSKQKCHVILLPKGREVADDGL